MGRSLFQAPPAILFFIICSFQDFCAFGNHIIGWTMKNTIDTDDVICLLGCINKYASFGILRVRPGCDQAEVNA